MKFEEVIKRIQVQHTGNELELNKWMSLNWVTLIFNEQKNTKTTTMGSSEKCSCALYLIKVLIV